MMMRNVLVLGLLGVMSVPLTASASLIEGQLNFTGAANISFGDIAFEGNDWTANSGASQVGGFVPLGGTTGGIVDITAADPVGAPIDIPDFITFNAAPNISFTLTYLYAGIEGAAGCSDSPPAAGQVCTPPLSPVNLANTSATSAFGSVDVAGFEIDTDTDETVPVVGTFSTPFSNLNFQQILAIIGNAPGGGTVTTSFSAQFTTTPSPEPGTWIQLMIGAGALGLGLVYRKRFGQA